MEFLEKNKDRAQTRANSRAARQSRPLAKAAKAAKSAHRAREGKKLKNLLKSGVCQNPGKIHRILKEMHQ